MSMKGPPNYAKIKIFNNKVSSRLCNNVPKDILALNN